jgi:UDP-glucuronate decarboxylase
MDTPKELTGPLNLGNPAEFTIRQLAERVIELTGSASQLRFEPLPQDDPRQRQPDISKAAQLLDWQPTVNLDAGLKRSIEYFDALLAEQGKPQT